MLESYRIMNEWATKRMSSKCISALSSYTKVCTNEIEIITNILIFSCVFRVSKVLMIDPK